MISPAEYIPVSEHTVLDALCSVVWWTIPYSACLCVEEDLWLRFIEVHCDEAAKERAKRGFYRFSNIWVGNAASAKLKQWQKVLKEAKKQGIHKTILKYRLRALRWETKYFSPNLP